MALTRLRARRIVIVGPGTILGRASSPEDRAERRQVTVLFSDLVGSTAPLVLGAVASSAEGFVIRVAPPIFVREAPADVL
jgi:class 3 adenylate cyclase